ncbi:MAG: hypothetical protein E7314_02285 [Clostridiales bacterium]|nr:hypothetical protein [Clostridiales bacterium]
MDIFKAKNYEEIGGNNEFDIEIGEGIDANATTVENVGDGASEIPAEEPTVENVGDGAHDIPADEQAKDEQAKDEQAKDEQDKDEQDKDEVGQIHAAILLEPQQDGTIEMTPVGATMNKASETINKEFAVIRDNIIDKETLAAQLHKVTELGIEDVMQSVEQLKGALDKLGIPYDKSKNLVVEDRNGGKTAFCLTDDKEAEQEQTIDTEQDMESQAIPETQEGKKIEGRIRDVSGIGSGELHAIVNAKDKKEFNKVIDNINDSKERATMAKEQAQQVDKRQEREAREQGGYKMER